jgi:hypothetical protein
MFKKKLLVLLMMSLATDAFASFNPFDVFNASNNTQQNASAGDQASQSQNATTPTATPQAVSAPQASQPGVAQQSQAAAASPYVQAPSLAAPATAKNAQLVAPATQKPVAPTNPSAAKSAPNSVPVLTRSNPVTSQNHFTSGAGAVPNATSLPMLGSGAILNPSNNNSQPPVIGSDSVLKVLNTINSNMVTWKKQDDQNKVGAGAQLVPTTTQNLQAFLLNQSGLSSFLQVPVIMNSNLSNQKRAIYTLLNDSNTGAVQIRANYGTSLLLMPLTQNDVAQALSPPSASGKAQAPSLSGYSGINAYLQFLTTLGSSQPGGAGISELMRYVLGQILSQTKPVTPGSDSLMATLQSAVNAPFMTQSQSNGSLTWLQQLQTASSPQLLRTIAILLAESNQMRYIQLQNQQTMMVLQTAQLAESDAENQRLEKLVASQAQMNATLLKIAQQMVVQNSKK